MGLVVITLWVTVVAFLLPYLEFESLKGLISFFAWSYLVVFCSFYLCILALFSDRKSPSEKKHFHEYLTDIYAEDLTRDKDPSLRSKLCSYFSNRWKLK